jgi:hypothetical protein
VRVRIKASPPGKSIEAVSRKSWNILHSRVLSARSKNYIPGSKPTPARGQRAWSKGPCDQVQKWGPGLEVGAVAGTGGNRKTLWAQYLACRSRCRSRMAGVWGLNGAPWHGDGGRSASVLFVLTISQGCSEILLTVWKKCHWISKGAVSAGLERRQAFVSCAWDGKTEPPGAGVLLLGVATQLWDWIMWHLAVAFSGKEETATVRPCLPSVRQFLLQIRRECALQLP